jgi:succinate dehydrogenase / fumarate reductase flavoprotein subunit
MKVFPGVHYSMGGLWVDFDQMTSIPGLFAAGECEYQYHGANRLGANALLSCIYAGMVSGPAATIYAAQGTDRRAAEQPSALFDDAARRWRDRFERLRRMKGQENARRIHRELGDVMVDNVTIVRTNENLDRTDAAIGAFMERWKEIGVTDTGDWSNQELPFVNQLDNMLELARLITRGARLRDESRGAHYKPEFPARDDEHWLKSTIATHTPKGPEFSFEAIDTSLLEPVARKYD